MQTAPPGRHGGQGGARDGDVGWVLVQGAHEAVNDYRALLGLRLCEAGGGGLGCGGPILSRHDRIAV